MSSHISLSGVLCELFLMFFYPAPYSHMLSTLTDITLLRITVFLDFVQRPVSSKPENTFRKMDLLPSPLLLTWGRKQQHLVALKRQKKKKKPKNKLKKNIFHCFLWKTIMIQKCLFSRFRHTKSDLPLQIEKASWPVTCLACVLKAVPIRLE
jgi:hypothetical protein